MNSRFNDEHLHVYIAHPVNAPDEDGRRSNIGRAKVWFAWAAELGFIPVAPWIPLCEVWDESRREEGLKVDFAAIARCDHLWLCGGRVSPGMELERAEADRLGITVHDLTKYGALPPPVEDFKRALKTVSEAIESKDFSKLLAFKRDIVE